MTFFGDSDIPAMLADMGVPVTVGAVTAKGLVNLAGQDVFQGDMAPVKGKVVVMTVQTSAFPGIKSGDPVTVDGTTWTIRSVQPAGLDGALTQIACMKPGARSGSRSSRLSPRHSIPGGRATFPRSCGRGSRRRAVISCRRTRCTRGWIRIDGRIKRSQAPRVAGPLRIAGSCFTRNTW
jgi:hypothetical protein